MMLPVQQFEQMLQQALHISEETYVNPDPLGVVAAVPLERNRVGFGIWAKCGKNVK